jgi:hypothetical protein
VASTLELDIFYKNIMKIELTIVHQMQMDTKSSHLSVFVDN